MSDPTVIIDSTGMRAYPGHFLFHTTEDHSKCPLPEFLQPIGTVWQCDCGKVYEATKSPHVDGQGRRSNNGWTLIDASTRRFS